MLSAQTQTLDQGAVTVDVNALEVIKHTTTVADHQQQTTTGVVIMLVLLSRKCHGILLILLRGAAGPIPTRSLSAGETRQGNILHDVRTKIAGRYFRSPADGRSSRHAMDASRPPNNTTASATSSIAKNNRNEAQLRVRTLSFDSFLMHTSRPTQSTA